jgi:RNA polymerase sigma-70 factor (ECF subfamily)
MPPDLNELIMRIREKDEAAFKTLVGMYIQPAYRLAFRILGNEEEAEETVQDTFVRVWQKIGSYDPSREFPTWMNRILVNLSLDRLEKIRRSPLVPIEQAKQALADLRSSNPGKQTEDRDIAVLIRYLAEGLPATQKLVFILRDIEGLSSGEVEAMTDLKETSVKSNLYYARRSIREQLTRIMSKEGSVKWS